MNDSNTKFKHKSHDIESKLDDIINKSRHDAIKRNDGDSIESKLDDIINKSRHDVASDDNRDSIESKLGDVLSNGKQANSDDDLLEGHDKVNGAAESSDERISKNYRPDKNKSYENIEKDIIESKLDRIISDFNNDDRLNKFYDKLNDKISQEDAKFESINSKLDDIIEKGKSDDSKFNEIDEKLDNIISSTGKNTGDDVIITKIEGIASRLDGDTGFTSFNSKLDNILDSVNKDAGNDNFDEIIAKLDEIIENNKQDSRFDEINGKLDEILSGVGNSEVANIDGRFVDIESKLNDLILNLSDNGSNDNSNGVIERSDSRFDEINGKLDEILSGVGNSEVANIDGRFVDIESKLNDLILNLSDNAEINIKLDDILSHLGIETNYSQQSRDISHLKDIESALDRIMLNFTDNTTDLDIDGKLRIIEHKIKEYSNQKNVDENLEEESDEKGDDGSLGDDGKSSEAELGIFDPVAFENEVISKLEKNRPDLMESQETEVGDDYELEKEDDETAQASAVAVDDFDPVAFENEVISKLENSDYDSSDSTKNIEKESVEDDKAEPVVEEEEKTEALEVVESDEEEDDDTELIEDLARSEYNVEEKQHNFNVAAIKGNDVTPLILLLTSFEEDKNKFDEILSNMNADVVNYSNKDEALKYIKNNYLDLILLDINSGFDPIEFLEEISSLNVPVLLIVDMDKEIPDELFNYSYNFIFKPFTEMEVQQTIYVVLIEHTKNHKQMLEAKSNIDEKNEELVIEKVESFLLLFISITLIVTGIVTFNLTFLQWIVFIPSVLMLIIAIVSLKKIEEPEPFEKPPFVSIIIPAHNEQYTIEGTVRCIADMKYEIDGKKNFELIVCNDGSTDNTGEILESLKDDIDVLRIVTRKPPQSGKGKGFVLNDAFNLSNGDIIGVFDADTRVHEDYLDIIIPYLNNPEVHGVQSRVKMYNKDENYLARMQHVEFMCFANTLRARDIMGFNGFLGGNGQFIKREAIADVGKWDGFAVTEDLNISIKMLVKGYKIRFCGEAAIYQEAVTTWKALFKQRTRWASGNFEALFIYTPVILRSKLSMFKKLGIMDHISFYAFNLFIFIGFVVFIVNMLAWFIFKMPTFIRMEAPLIIGIISAFAFFPPLIISLTRDKTNIITFLKDMVGYWVYCYHLIPLFFKTMGSMFTRKERTWDKTEHVKKECDVVIDVND